MSNYYQTYRSDISKYQADHFSEFEKSKLESINLVKYVNKKNIDLHGKIILITNSNSDITSIPFINKNIVLHIHPNSGYDNLPIEYIKTAKHPIIIGNPIRAHAVSNYILSCLFQRYTQINHVSKWDHFRSWKHDLISEKNILILGHGHIGNIVANTLSSISNNVSIYDPYKNYPNLEQENADIIILCQSLNPSSEHQINYDFLSTCKKDVTIINAARGRLIKQVALIKFLKDFPNSFAYLDVYEEEPADFSAFSKIPNISTTSHIAGVFNGLDQQIISFNFNIIQDFIHFFNNFKKFTDKYKNLELKNRIVNDHLI